MKKTDIRSLTTEELNKKFSDLKTELFNLRFSIATGNLPDNSQIKKVKKEIARIKTIIREREIKSAGARG